MHVLLLALMLTVQQPDDVAQKIDDAAQLVDAGKFDRAIAALKKIVAAHPKNTTAKYELALAYTAKGDHARCRKTVEPLAAVEGRAQVDALALLGNCLGGMGEHERALAAYRKGLKLAPSDASILYNLSVALVKDEKLDEARQLLETDLRANPSDAVAHSLLANIFAAQGYRTPAVFSYLRFLALDPTSAEATGAAEHLRALLNDSKIDLKQDARKDEGDYSTMDILLAAGAAARGTEEEAKLSEFEQMRLQVSHLIDHFLIAQALKEGNDFTAAVHRPFFAAMKGEKLVDIFAGIAIARLDMPGRDEWAKTSDAEVARYGEWLAPQLDRPVVHLRH